MTEQLDLVELVQSVPPCPAPDNAEPIYLERIDPTQNMRRYYQLSLQPGLFGDIGLVREWGRIGRRGQSKTDWFAGAAEAEMASARLSRQKQRRGYKYASTA